MKLQNMLLVFMFKFMMFNIHIPVYEKKDVQQRKNQWTSHFDNINMYKQFQSLKHGVDGMSNKWTENIYNSDNLQKMSFPFGQK